MRFFKKLKHDWLRWKQNFGKSTKKQVEEENPIEKAEKLIENLKVELVELHKIRSEYRANSASLKNDIGYFNSLIIRNNDKIQQLEGQEVLTENDKKVIAMYEQENQNCQLEIQKRKQKGRELAKEFKPIENHIDTLTIQIRDYQNSLRLLTAKIKILSTQMSIKANESKLKVAFGKLEEWAEEAEHNKENIKKQSQND